MLTPNNLASGAPAAGRQSRVVLAIALCLIFMSIFRVFPALADTIWNWQFSDTQTAIVSAGYCNAFNSDGICADFVQPVYAPVPVTAKGQLTTGAEVSPGVLQITGISGTFNGAPITGILPPNVTTYGPLPITIPSTFQSYAFGDASSVTPDNLLYVSSTPGAPPTISLDSTGLGFVINGNDPSILSSNGSTYSNFDTLQTYQAYIVTNDGRPGLFETTLDGGFYSTDGNGSFTATSACAADLEAQGAITEHLDGASASGQSTEIHASFIPAVGGKTLSQAAQDCGVTAFDWVQTIDSVPNPSPYVSINNPFTRLTGGFSDPPAGGGYGVPNVPLLPLPVKCPAILGIPTLSSVASTAYPFYYNPTGPSNDCMSLAHNTDGNIDVLFGDAPADPCLAGGSQLIQAVYCGNSSAPDGQGLMFTTQLVGVASDPTNVLNGGYTDVPLCTSTDTTCISDTTFKWEDSFNGTSGGIPSLSNGIPVDPGSGTGGITLLQGTLDVPEPSSLLVLVTSIVLLLFPIKYNNKIRLTLVYKRTYNFIGPLRDIGNMALRSLFRSGSLNHMPIC